MFGMGGRGPKPAPATAAATAPSPAAEVAVALTLTPAQKDKLDALGGADWLRRQIDQAQAPSAVSGPAPAARPARRKAAASARE